MPQQAKKPSVPRCLECGKPLPAGRPDRKFCSLQCKNRWHNARYGRFNSYRLWILNTLDRNHHILRRLHDAGFNAVSKQEILSMGFQPDCFTGCARVNGHVEYACYDFRYRISDNRIWRIDRVDPFSP